MVSLIESLNSLFWTRRLIENRILQADKVTHRTLFIIRVIGFVFIAQLTIHMIIVNVSNFYLYLTQWSAITAFVYYALLMFYYFVNPCRQTCLWKVTHVFFEASFTLGFVATLVFWCGLVPLLIWTKVSERYPLPKFWHNYVLDVETHGGNYFFIFLDFYFNRIEFAFRHLLLIVPFGILYIVFLVIYTLATGIEVYPAVTFKNWLSYAFLLAGTACFLCSFSLGVCISTSKKNRYLRPMRRITQASNKIDPESLEASLDPTL